MWYATKAQWIFWLNFVPFQTPIRESGVSPPHPQNKKKAPETNLSRVCMVGHSIHQSWCVPLPFCPPFQIYTLSLISIYEWLNEWCVRPRCLWGMVHGVSWYFGGAQVIVSEGCHPQDKTMVATLLAHPPRMQQIPHLHYDYPTWKRCTSQNWRTVLRRSMHTMLCEYGSQVWAQPLARKMVVHLRW